MNKLTLMIATVAVAAGCGKKNETVKSTAGDAATAATAPSAPATPAAAAADKPKTAEGGEVSGLQLVADCPKSLSGSEEVARVIKKECGPVSVTANYTVEGTLTLEAGAVLKVFENATIMVGYAKPAKIIVKGTAADPVIMTAAGDQVAGFWTGLHLMSNASRSQIEGLVIEHAGNERGALFIDAKDVVVKGVTIRNAKEIGLRLDGDATVAELSGSTFEKAGQHAISVPASGVGFIGAGNKLDEGALVEVRGGTVDRSAKWPNLGAPYVITENVSIDGKGARAVVEIEPGTELRFADGVELAVGYANPGGLTVNASAEKPVVFTSAGEKEPGRWKGIHGYSNGELRLAGVIVEHAGSEDRAAVWAQDGASLSLKGSTVRTNVVGLQVEDETKVAAIEGNTFTGNSTLAVALPANHVAALAADNKLEGQKFAIRGGTVKASGTWHAFPGAQTEVTENLAVTGRAVLTLAPGVDLAFATGVEFTIGYDEIGGLKAQGTPDRPVRLHGVVDEAGAWKGVILYSNARDVLLENVILEGTGGSGGVDARDGAVAKIVSVVCKKCEEAALARVCGAKVEVGEVKAEDGTPVGDKKPEGCE